MKTIAEIIHHQNNSPLYIFHKGYMVYCEYQGGSWWKRQFDSNGYELYYETSYGDMEDNRP